MVKKITPFESSVYEKVKTIPCGMISTYKLVAQALGNPRASQAVGTALKNNPTAPVVPCHRVLPSSYMIGGFFGDQSVESLNVKKKMALLKKEGIQFEGACVTKCNKYRDTVTYTFK
jgi:O-6-methylguanine DNA methyltransferase